ncbi:MAG: hypothetical protein K2Q45_09065 [Nitrosomonas sp.]|nr:hypothetical protein [Nitrosomonas sp.]
MNCKQGLLLLIAQYGFDNVFEMERFMNIVRIDSTLLLKPCNVTLTLQFSQNAPQSMCSVEKFPIFAVYKPLEVMYFGSHDTDLTNCKFIHLHFSGENLFFVATHPVNPWYETSVDGRFTVWDNSDPPCCVRLPWNVRFIFKESVFYVFLQQKKEINT